MDRIRRFRAKVESLQVMMTARLLVYTLLLLLIGLGSAAALAGGRGTNYQLLGNLWGSEIVKHEEAVRGLHDALKQDVENLARELKQKKAEIIDYPDFRPWETQRVGIVLYNSKNDFIELSTSTGGVSTGHSLLASYGKYKDGEWLSTYSSNLQKVATHEFKIQKIGRKYGAFFKDAKGKWVSIGIVSVLKGKYRPGIIAYRAPNANEIMAEFDSFKIKELE